MFRARFSKETTRTPRTVNETFLEQVARRTMYIRFAAPACVSVDVRCVVCPVCCAASLL